MKLGYSVNEAAELVGLSKTKVRDLINKGEIKVRRAGRKIVIPHEELMRWLRGESA